jgi:hypothetical protein
MPFLIIYLTSVVIDDFHIYRTLIGPSETDSVLIIYADAVLPLAISSQRLQPVPWWRAQEVEGVRGIQQRELTYRDMHKRSFSAGLRVTKPFYCMYNLTSAYLVRSS